MSKPNKEYSPLVQSVMALDEYFSEIERVGNKITTMDLKSEFDFEQARRLISRFAECGEGVSSEVMRLSTYLGEARVKADTLAKGVAERAEMLNSRNSDARSKMAEFRALGEKVRALSLEMAQLRRPEGEVLSAEDRENLSVSLGALESRLEPLIEQASRLRQEAHISKMKVLEQNADSLTQTLQSIRQKLSTLNLPKIFPQ
jgi:chromosome segregation ATPase